MGCLSTITRRIGGDLRLLATRMNDLRAIFMPASGIVCFMFRRGGVRVTTQRIGGISCRMGLVCPTNIGLGIIWASDGRLITLEGGFLIGND